MMKVKKTKVDTFLTIEFIKVDYLEWLKNMVLVKKKTRRS